MKPMLYLSNGPRQRSVARLEERFQSYGITVDQRWAYNGDFPQTLDGYCGVFLSGSPHSAYEDVAFINREHDLIVAAARHRIPMLGICFGSQILASALCGRDQVFRRTYCEVGYKTLYIDRRTAADPLVAALSQTLRMFVWHNDEVRSDHADMRILARSDECSNQIWRFRDLPVWGIQGHPEVDRAQALHWFELVRSRLEADGATIEDLATAAEDAIDAKTMLHAFANFCLSVPP